MGKCFINTKNNEQVEITATLLGKTFTNYDVSGYKMIIVSYSIFNDDNFGNYVQIISGESEALFKESLGTISDHLYVRIFKIKSETATLQVKIGDDGASQKYVTVFGIK